MKDQVIICIGAALIDESYHFDNQPIDGTSNPSTHYKTSGGVARNIAHHLALLGETVELISHFGKDADGLWLTEECSRIGIGISQSISNELNTGKFAAFLSPDGNLISGAVSTHFETVITPNFLRSKIVFLKTASLVVLDCNLSRESINWLVHFCRTESIPCIIEPVSVAKAARLKEIDLNNVLLITPNIDELIALNATIQNHLPNDEIDQILERGIKNLWIRKGKAGSDIYSLNHHFHLDASDINVTDSTGAGDAALSGWIYAWLRNKNPRECLKYGHAMAGLVIQVKGAIIQNLTPELLEFTINN